jgi:hypothetical protein
VGESGSTCPFGLLEGREVETGRVGFLVPTLFVLANRAPFFVEPERFFFVITDFGAEDFWETDFFGETVTFFKEAFPFFLGFEEAFTVFPFFAAPVPLEEVAGLVFLATDFFFEAFFGKDLRDALRTDFFVAMQSPFLKRSEKYRPRDESEEK